MMPSFKQVLIDVLPLFRDVFGGFLSPIGFIWLLLLIGFVASLWRRRRAGACYFGGLVMVFLLIGSFPLPVMLLTSLERPFVLEDRENLPETDAVVILGGGLHASESDLLSFNLGAPADRIVCGFELMRLGKANALVLGGAGRRYQGEIRPEGEFVRDWFEAWGLPAESIHVLGNCSDTRDEAQRTAELLEREQWQDITLVTSASHMKRSKAVFESLGLQVHPVACDFLGMSTVDSGKGWSFIPKLDGFYFLGLALHEKIGWHYYRWRGWINP